MRTRGGRDERRVRGEHRLGHALHVRLRDLGKHGERGVHGTVTPYRVIKHFWAVYTVYKIRFDTMYYIVGLTANTVTAKISMCSVPARPEK